MRDRREYMREYKRRYRAAKNATKHDGDAFIALSCLSVEEADKLGRGAVNGWALVFEDGDELSGADATSLLDAFKAVKTKNTVYVCNLKVWGRFLVVEADRRGLKVSADTTEKNSYRTVVNNTGDWIGFEINLDGNRTYIKNFSEVIRTPLDRAYTDFCGGQIPPDATLNQIAGDMSKLMAEFKKSLKTLSGGVFLSANTLSGYAQKLAYCIAGRGCIEYGRDVWRATFPPISKDAGDEMRAAKVYRGGWNYMDPTAREYRGAGYVLDVRSFYPSIYASAVPCGAVKWTIFNDKVQDKIDNNIGYYGVFNVLELSAHLKNGAFPTIQIINESGTEYLTEINYTGGAAFMLDTNDIKALYDNYNVDFLTLDYGYTTTVKHVDFLDEYATRLFHKKSRPHADAVSTSAKHLINSLSGRFGINAYRNEIDVVKNKNYKAVQSKYVGELGYLPAAIYINSRGRLLITELAKKAKDVFLYSDTDSIIIKGDEIPAELRYFIGDKMGQLSVKRFTESRFFGLKCYGLKFVLDGWKWTVAGASPDMLKEIKADASAGQVLTGGAVPQVYPDGTIAFKKREFTLARNTIF